MEIELLNKKYKVVVVKKNNKNTYLRVTPDLTILITTNKLVTKKELNNLLIKHKDFLIKNIKKTEKQLAKQQDFYYLGNKYDIILMPSLKQIELSDDKIYVPSVEKLDNWYKEQTLNIFSKQLLSNYNLFEEPIIIPKLRIRKMKTRWGVCNVEKQIITLNSELCKYDLDIISYVVIHELAHFIYPNHSKDFWALVSKYCPNYKKLRKELKD